MHRSIWAALAVTLLKGSLVQAQISTNATCSSNFGWMNNTLGQSPCLVAAYLQGACLNGVWTVPALPHRDDGQLLAYTAPDSATRSLCTCSWAVYNLMSACASCQEEAWLSWGLWQTSCAAPNNLLSNDAFPSQVPVPGGTKIPKYAARDPQGWTGGSFNATEAQRIGSQDFVATPTSSSSSSTNTESSTPSGTTSSDGGGGTPVGPIVGGVVGGVLGMLLIGVLATFLICPSVFARKRVRNANQGDLPHPTGGGPAYPGPSTGTPPTGMLNSDAITISTVSQGHIVAPIPVRPVLLTQPSTASYSTTSVDHSMAAPSIYSQPSTHPQQSYTVHGSQPSSAQYRNPSLSPPASTVPPSLTTERTMTETPSIRSFLTRMTTRARHLHSSSESTVTSTSSLLHWSPSNGGNSNSNNNSRNNSQRQQNTTEQIVPYVLPPTSISSSALLTTTLTSSGSAPPVAVQPPAQVQIQNQNHVQPYILDPAFASQQATGDRKQRPGPVAYGPVEDLNIPSIHGSTTSPPSIVNPSTATATAATFHPSLTAETVHGAYNPSALGVPFGGNRMDEANGEDGIDGVDGIDRRRNNLSPATSILDPAPSYAMAIQMQPQPHVHVQTGPAAQYRQTLQGVAEYPEEKAAFSGREPEM